MMDTITSSEQILIREIDEISPGNSIDPLYSSFFKILTDQSPNPFQCSLCPEMFKFHASLICHVKIVHENLERFQNNDEVSVKLEPLEEFRDFPCDFCEATFPNSVQRSWHTKNSHGIQNIYSNRVSKRKKIKLKIILKKSGPTKKGTEAVKNLKKKIIEMKQRCDTGHFQMTNDVNPNIFKVAKEFAKY